MPVCGHDRTEHQCGNVRKGYRYTWGDLWLLLSFTDVNIVNIETTLTHSNRQLQESLT